MSFAAASDTSAVYFSGRGYHSSAASITATQNGAGTVAAFNHGDTPSFSDLLDIVNPLQHIPVVGTIYRQLTGDTESAMSSIIGGTLYGGPIGGAAAMLDLGVHDATGKSTGDAIAGLFGSDTKDTMTASTGAAAGAAKTAATTPTKSLALAAGAVPTQGFVVPPSPSATASAAQAAKPVASAAPASMAPTVLAQAGTAAPAQAKAAAAKPMIVASAQPTQSTSSGPVHEGNYLVFGSGDGDAANAGAGGNGTNTKSGQADIAPLATPITVTAMPDAAPKQFAINGGNSAPAKSLPAVDSNSFAVAAQGPSTGGISMQHPRVFPVPPRNGPATPQAVLPPPTTGPGALPGGKSQALSAQEMAVAQDPAHNFLSAYTQALDKYHAAQNLAAHPIQPATSIITGKPDPVPDQAVDEDETPEPAAGDITLH